MLIALKPYPKEFRNDLVNVARSHEPGTHLKQIATDLGISENGASNNWFQGACPR